MLVLLDNRDSFTFNLLQAFLHLGEEVLLRHAASISPGEILDLAPDFVVVGPGPGRPEGAGCSVDLMRSLRPEIPILGVCLGLQALGSAFGARIVPARTLAHGQTTGIEHTAEGLFAGLPNPAHFTRYNSLVVEEASLPPELEVTARAPDGDIMALRHRTRPLVGVQFHPEAILSQGGEKLLANFIGRGASTGRDRQPESDAATAPPAAGALRHPPNA